MMSLAVVLSLSTAWATEPSTMQETGTQHAVMNAQTDEGTPEQARPGLAAAAGGGAPPSSVSASSTGASVDEEEREPTFDCPERPTAYLLAHDHPELPPSRSAELLEEVGFVVEPLPLDASPGMLRGLVFIESGASAHPDYAAYMERHAEHLYQFVDRANVLVQMAQDPEVEREPPFLPTTHGAVRGADRIAVAHVVTSDSELMVDVDSEEGTLGWAPEAGWSPFVEHGGFSVTLAAADTGDDAIFLEGAYGQGRFVLTGMRFDRATSAASAEEIDFGRTFARNLLAHVQAVCARTTAALHIAPSSSQDGFIEGSFVLAVLPDTQVYALRYPGLLAAQTAWIVANAKRLDIRYVLHLGDVVNNNTAVEWQRAAQALSMLDGVVPYSIAPGNHDYGPSGDASTRRTLMNDYISFERHAELPSFGGAFEAGRLDNTYRLFSAGGRDFILMSLEWGPRDVVIDWANAVMAEHPDRDGIFVTHAFLNETSLRYDHTDDGNPQAFNPHEYSTPGGVNDGEELWQKLVRHHNFIITLNGHVLGEGVGRLVSTTDTGATCHQILSNYQMRKMGGEAYMRLLEFAPDGRTVRVLTYSPLFDRFLDDPRHNFSIVLD